jgi:exodeoxyribonuclease V
MDLTLDQKDGIKKAKKWFKSSSSDQLFKIAGYAGTGKTTIINQMIRELKLDDNMVKFATFTGKAALVLTLKGCFCSTIHKLIYNVQEITEIDPYTKRKKKVFKFVKKDELDPSILLIVIDESSMVNKEIFYDLVSFGKPIIFLGDPGQLPPIGEDLFLLQNPDVFLTEIHRQAQHNPIIYLSMLAREGKYIKEGNYTDQYGKSKVHVLKEDFDKYASLLPKADQVICGKNSTRIYVNNYMREMLGYDSLLPSYGEKLICIKNNWGREINDIALINGMIGYVNNEITDKDINWKGKRFNLDFRPEFFKDKYFEGISADLTKFIPEDSYEYRENRNKNKTLEQFKFLSDDDFIKNINLNLLNSYDYEEKEEEAIDYFDFGYCITCHKSQGSSWDKVLVINEYLGDKEFHKKWLYTSITRSSDKLILAK